MEVAPANRKGHAARLEHSLDIFVLQGLPCLWISAKSQSPEDMLGEGGAQGAQLGYLYAITWFLCLVLSESRS